MEPEDEDEKVEEKEEVKEKEEEPDEEPRHKDDPCRKVDGPLIPYWSTNIEDCIMACKNESVCMDYCTFRFEGATEKEAIWTHPHPIFNHGTWYLNGHKMSPMHQDPHEHSPFSLPGWGIPNKLYWQIVAPYNYYKNFLYPNRRVKKLPDTAYPAVEPNQIPRWFRLPYFWCDDAKV